LVASALVLGRQAEVGSAAEFLLTPDSGAGDVVKRAASRALGRATDVHARTDSAGAEIRKLRRRLKDQPRNSIAWVELARQYAILGRVDKAREAMRRAVYLVDGNRFVLRSAARLFVHSNDADEADHILRTREATRHDPWLLAAQIAVSSVTGTRSPLLKRAKAIVAEQRFAPKHLAELASALATVEFENGSLTGSRRLFRQSLTDPTDNAVAQAAWAARRIEGLGVPSAVIEKPHTFEARAWSLFSDRDWRGGMAACDEWLADEPFSSRPAMAGSYYALVAVADYTSAERFAREGLVSNPGNPGLLNNLAVALADQGQLDEAEEALARIRRAPEVTDRIVITATYGLIQFRRRNFAVGRALYQRAIELARRSDEEYMRILAIAHLAREEFIAGTTEANAVWASLPNHAQIEEQFPDVLVFLQQVSRLRELRERHSHT
jgi:Tfp pilus assembly protein PilF